jgi:hypothetical protein
VGGYDYAKVTAAGKKVDVGQVISLRDCRGGNLVCLDRHVNNDEQCVIQYKIGQAGQKITLAEFLREKSLSFDGFVGLVLGIVGAVEEIGRFGVLNYKGLVFDNDYIFVDDNGANPCLIYLPLYSGESYLGEFVEFVESLYGYTKIEDGGDKFRNCRNVLNAVPFSLPAYKDALGGRVKPAPKPPPITPAKPGPQKPYVTEPTPKPSGEMSVILSCVIFAAAAVTNALLIVLFAYPGILVRAVEYDILNALMFWIAVALIQGFGSWPVMKKRKVLFRGGTGNESGDTHIDTEEDDDYPYLERIMDGAAIPVFINKECFVIGRGAEYDYECENIRVSAPHANIIRKGGGLYIAEAKKTSNGTYLAKAGTGDYKKLEYGKEYRLNEGDKIRIANKNTEFTVFGVD